jgi:hypothetical protein
MNKILTYVKLNKFTFSLLDNIPEIKPEVINKLAEEVSPLTFEVYFDSFLKIMENWTVAFTNKISSADSEGNYFTEIPPEKCISMLNKI